MATVISAQGAVITIDDDTSPTPVKVTIGGADSFTFGDGEAADIDVTTLASTRKEWRQGLADEGAFTLNFKVRDPNDAGQAEMASARALQAVREVVITLPSGDVATFDMYVKSMPSEGAVDGVLAGSANCKITGEVVWSTAP